MSRLLLAAIAALVLIAPTTATGGSSAQLRGVVAQKLPANNLIRVESLRAAHILRVPGSQARIRVGQRIELRGTVLRQRSHGSRVLARSVVVVRSVAGGAAAAAPGGSPAQGDDSENGPDDGQNDDNSGPGRADGDDDDNSGPGNVDDDDDSTDDDSDDDSDDSTDDDDTGDDDSTDDD